jgi:hypothetical protein
MISSLPPVGGIPPHTPRFDSLRPWCSTSPMTSGFHTSPDLGVLGTREKAPTDVEPCNCIWRTHARGRKCDVVKVFPPIETGFPACSGKETECHTPCAVMFSFIVKSPSFLQVFATRTRLFCDLRCRFLENPTVNNESQVISRS